jgi:hypothetical protein
VQSSEVQATNNYISSRDVVSSCIFACHEFIFSATAGSLAFSPIADFKLTGNHTPSGYYRRRSEKPIYLHQSFQSFPFCRNSPYSSNQLQIAHHVFRLRVSPLHPFHIPPPANQSVVNRSSAAPPTFSSHSSPSTLPRSSAWTHGTPPAAHPSARPAPTRISAPRTRRPRPDRTRGTCFEAATAEVLARGGM